MASAGTSSAHTMSTAFIERTKRISIARSQLTKTDLTFPAADVPELMVVLRDVLYGLDCAKVTTDACCIFAVLDGDVDMEGSDDEDYLLRLAKHFLFAVADVRRETFLHLMLFAVGIFGRHCQAGSCRQCDAGCARRTLGAEAVTKENALERAEAFLSTSTYISEWAKAVMEMRSVAVARGRAGAFRRWTEKHKAILASHVYKDAYRTSVTANCFEMLGGYYSIGKKFHATTRGDIAVVKMTFDGGTKTYFPKKPVESTATLEAALGNTKSRNFVMHVFKAPPPDETGKAQKGRTGQSPQQAAAAAGELELVPYQSSVDPSGGALIEALALSELAAKPDDEPSHATKRVGRFVLVPAADEKDIKLFSVPTITKARLADIKFDPTPAAPAAGGGEASALADIAQIKRAGHISVAPDWDRPDNELNALSMDEVSGLGEASFNSFRGFHGDHAYAMFHPSDVKHRGVDAPDMHIPADLVLAGAWGYLTAGANLTLPTTAVFFKAGGPVSASLYASSADAVKKHCVNLACYLSAAAKFHNTRTVGDGTAYLASNGAASLHKVVQAVRETHTFQQLIGRVRLESGGAAAASLRTVEAAMLKLAASFYPSVLDDFEEMLGEYKQWKEMKGESSKMPKKFLAEAVAPAEAARRRATLTICGYIFMPDSGGILGVSDVFQLGGEGIRYGEFDVLLLAGSLQHGVLAVSNSLEDGLLGYRIRGHSAHTLKKAHRLILEDAVKTHFGEAAHWAAAGEADAWLQPPTDAFVVDQCTPSELVLRTRDGAQKTILLAVHKCTPSSDCSGTVVPLVFAPTNELVFERSTRCPRGAAGATHERHGAQLLRPGDVVTVWTTPAADDQRAPCLIAARIWNLHTGGGGPPECTLLPSITGLDGLAFDVVDTGTEAVPTPLEMMDAVVAHGIVHRTPATVALYLYSPTKTGVENVPGQGVGKSELQRFVTAAAGANVVDTVNDYKTLVENNQFCDIGHTSLFTIVDDVYSPKFLLTGKVKSAVTAKVNVNRVKHDQGNAENDNHNTLLTNGNEFVSQDAVEEANIKEQRRLHPSRAQSTYAGCTEYFAYVYGTYRNVSPLIYKCLLEHWRSSPGVRTRTTAELQDMAKRAKVHWSGQVPMHVAFLQALYSAPRLEKNKLTEARNLASLSGKKTTLLTGVDKACKHVSEKDMLAAAQQYVHEHFDSRDKNQARARENAYHIVKALKQAAEELEGAWAKLYCFVEKEGGKGMAFSVELAKIKAAVEASGFKVFESHAGDEAPTF